MSTKTILVHELQQLATRVQLTNTLAASTPGEELVIFNQIPDGNGGQPLPGNPLFGEAVATPPVVMIPLILETIPVPPPQDLPN